MLVGGPRTESLIGDIGDDVLNGSSNADRIDGGTGTDKAQLDSADTRVAVEVFV